MSKKRHSSVVSGLVFITLGILFLLHNFRVIDLNWQSFWAYLVTIMGIIFWIGFIADRKKSGFIMPGTILIVIGLIFIYCSRYGWYAMNNLWPFFILAPAAGLYAMYIFDKHDRGLLVPAGILTAIGLVFLLQSYHWIKMIWPVVVIFIGILLLMKQKDNEEELKE
ncbi:MAG: hypothetical protein U5O15_01080 [Candidatus Krumholzibacteriota bacterium]|nr:hypothetical protein [Candidatus Krumholzibacteriota bacterium]